MRLISCVLLALVLATTSGCSFSKSSGSISDSISSPSESISDSSSGDDGGSSSPEPETPQDTSSYKSDVSQLAVTFIKSGGDIAAFQSAVSDLAKTRGLTDWEADPDTTQAIGMGAGTAGLEEPAFNEFATSLFGDDLTKINELRKGYQQTDAQPDS
jgi:hypothetical protein